MRRLACLTLLSPLLLGCPDKEEDTLTGTASEDSSSETESSPTTGDASTGTTDEPSTTETGGSATDSDSGTIGMSGTDTGDTAASEGDTEDPINDCQFLIDRTFLSLEEMECGLGPNGVELCNWTLAFTADTYTHQYSDIGESGTYTCSNGKISGLAGGEKRNGTVNAATGTLIWEDIQYQPQ